MTDIKYDVTNLGTFIFKTKISEHIRIRLLEECKSNSNLQKYNHYLAGHLDNQFRYNDNTIKWFYEEINSYLNAYRNHHCKFYDLPYKNVDLRAIDLWVNVMKPGDFNPMHTHGGDITFVIYLNYPKELHEEKNKFVGTSAVPGSIEFNLELGIEYIGKKYITPNEGDFYIFPAKLNHMVLPFKSDVERISVSGNLEILNKNQLGENYF